MSQKKKRIHAVLALDPGGTTGVAAGYVELRPTRRETLATLSNRKAVEVEGSWLEQAEELSALMVRFEYAALVEHQIPIPNIHICIEDFILRRRDEGGATGNLTSCWVAAAAHARYVQGQQNDEANPDIKYQQPSHAKTLMTNERLKSYGLWEVGSTHKRDAWRHFGLRVDGLIT